MTHKTFISYKYSESLELRDRIIKALGDDAKYYQGEDGYTEDMSSLKADTIKNKLADMMYDTSVTILILSPKMTESKWIDWEIEYCLKHIPRKGRVSQTNGIVGVIKKVNGKYDWFKETGTNCHGASITSYKMNKIFDVISQNHFNSNPEQWHCSECKTYDYMNGSYITFVEEDEFIDNIKKYINNAYEKSENDASGYEIYLP